MMVLKIVLAVSGNPAHLNVLAESVESSDYLSNKLFRGTNRREKTPY